MIGARQVIGKTILDGNEKCKVRYNQRSDKVVLEVGGISLTLDVHNFMMVNEMMRKAAARIAIQTKLIENN